jgi:hypothetical protein
LLYQLFSLLGLLFFLFQLHDLPFDNHAVDHEDCSTDGFFFEDDKNVVIIDLVVGILNLFRGFLRLNFFLFLIFFFKDFLLLRISFLKVELGLWLLLHIDLLLIFRTVLFFGGVLILIVFK